LQERDVLVNELFLQTDGVGGDDDAAVLFTGRRQDRRDQVAERLADARARLDHEVPLAGNGLGDRLGHVELLWPGFVVVQALGHEAARAEDGGDGHFYIVTGPDPPDKVRDDKL
jgi:hypothetical protein